MEGWNRERKMRRERRMRTMTMIRRKRKRKEMYLGVVLSQVLGVLAAHEHLQQCGPLAESAHL
jgi:hypothetical protein